MVEASVGRRRKRVLVVEDSFLEAEDVCGILADLGMEAVGPATTVATALMLIQVGDVDAALLDIGLDRETVFPVCAPLAERRIPFAFVTGTVNALPETLNGIPLILKPVRRTDILRIVTALLKQS